MTDVFISYAREDEARVRDIVRALEQQNWSVFWDRRIPAGKSWRSYIGQALADAKCVIVVWSQWSVGSQFVSEEAEEGKQRGILVPVLIGSVQPPFGFRSIHAADLTEPDSQTTQFRQLLDDVAAVIQGAQRTYLEREPSEPPASKELSAPATRRSAYAITAIVLLAIASAVYLGYRLSRSPSPRSIPDKGSGQQQRTVIKPEKTSSPPSTEIPRQLPPAAPQKPALQAEPQPAPVKPIQSEPQARAELEPPTPILPNGSYLVGLQTVGIEQERWNDLAKAIESAGFHFYNQCSNFYSEKQPWHAGSSTVLYYHKEAKQKAVWVAGFMNKLTKLNFQVARGAGLCVDPDRKKTTLFVHVLP